VPSCSPANREGLRLGEVDPRILSRGMLFIAVVQRISFTDSNIRVVRRSTSVSTLLGSTY